MKIAFYISPYDTVPPQQKTIIAPWYLAEKIVNSLVQKGHQVTIYCAYGSKVEAQIRSNTQPTYVYQENLSDKEFLKYSIFEENRLASLLLADTLREKYDLVHVFHGIIRLLPFISVMKEPVLGTIHDPIFNDSLKYYQKYSDLKHLYYAALTRSHAKGFVTFSSQTEIVTNGINTDYFRFEKDRFADAKLLIVGRIVPEKGFEDAIITAKQTDYRLMIAGQVYEQIPEAEKYFQNKIKPQIDQRKVYMEPAIKYEHLIGHYQTAKALLFPIHWEEPFGLVMVEAMACGTPVIAYNRGSVSEIVRDGVTGFIIDPPEEDLLVNSNDQLPNSKQFSNSPSASLTTSKQYPNSNIQIENPSTHLPIHPSTHSLINPSPWIIKKRGIEGLVEAVNRIGEIDRVACRKHVEENFTVEKMVEGYERVYQKIIMESGR